MPAPTSQQIRTEVDTDPKALGYAALRTQTNAPEALAARMNEAGASGETLFRSYVLVEDVIAGIVRAEYDALAAAGKTFLNEVLLKAARVKSGDANVRASMSGLFGTGTTTRTNLTNLASRSASRADALWGEGITVSAQDVSLALEL